MTPDQDNLNTKNLLSDDNDWFLENYVRSLNGTDGDMHITILIDGFLVSGLLVGGNRYFQEILDEYLADGREELQDSIAQLQKRIDAYTTDRMLPDKPVAYLHMLLATFHHPIGAGMPRKGTSFRAKLNKVSGFYFGGYLPQQNEQLDSLIDQGDEESNTVTDL